MQLIEGSPLSDWELWACAAKLLTEHGDQARLHAAERLADLDAADDRLGYLTWCNISLCLVALSVPMPFETCQ